MESTRDLIGPALRLGIRPSRHVLVAGIGLFVFDALVMFAPRLWTGTTATLVVVVALGFLRALLRSWLRPGYLRAVRETWRGDDATFEGVVGPIDTFLDVLLVNVVGGALAALSVVAGAIPGLALLFLTAERGSHALATAGLVLAFAGGVLAYLYAWLGVRFAEHAIVLEGYGAVAALHRAWRAAEGRRLALATVAIAAVLFELAGLTWGLMTFGWGVVLGVPVGRLAGDYASVGQYLVIARTLPPTAGSPRPRAPFAQVEAYS